LYDRKQGLLCRAAGRPRPQIMAEARGRLGASKPCRRRSRPAVHRNCGQLCGEPGLGRAKAAWLRGPA
jgi:hypothetical protein